MTVDQVRRTALSLPLAERASLVDELLASLDRPDPAIDALWIEECHKRFAAFEVGRMEAIDSDTVFKEFDPP